MTTEELKSIYGWLERLEKKQDRNTMVLGILIGVSCGASALVGLIV